MDTGEAGLVAHYPFDGNANDATPYNNHGVIGGNPVFEASTHPLGAGKQNIKFDGDKVWFNVTKDEAKAFKRD